jgi:hypothetical protein
MQAAAGLTAGESTCAGLSTLRVHGCYSDSDSGCAASWAVEQARASPWTGRLIQSGWAI